MNYDEDDIGRVFFARGELLKVVHAPNGCCNDCEYKGNGGAGCKSLDDDTSFEGCGGTDVNFVQVADAIKRGL